MLMAQCFLDREFYQSTIVVLSTSRLVPRSSRFVINDFSYEDLLWLKEHISEPGYWMKLEIFRRMATALVSAYYKEVDKKTWQLLFC